MLKAPEDNSHFQLTPLVRQPEALPLEASVNIGKLFPDPAQRAHHFLKELVADSAAPVVKPKRAAGFVLYTEDH